MPGTFFIATDSRGVQRVDGNETVWNLEATAANEGTLVLFEVEALLSVLDERIFAVEPIGDPTVLASGTVQVSAAKLGAETTWDADTAARFALDCATHVLGEAGSVTLPGGRTLAEVIDDAREVLDGASGDAEHRVGLLARVAATRRLRKEGVKVGDLVFDALARDTAEGVEALDDPAYDAIASVREAVLAALDALRRTVLPRYYRERAQAASDKGGGQDDEPSTPGSIFLTPFGPFVIGVEHHDLFASAPRAAAEAALRAREAARDHGGDGAYAAELSYQASLLTSVISPG